jgi:hypothetical protein
MSPSDHIGSSGPSDERPWSTFASPGNWLFFLFLVVALVFVALSVGCVAPTTGSETADNAIVEATGLAKLWNTVVGFFSKYLVPIAIGGIVFVVTEGIGTIFQAISGSVATLGTAKAMDDPPPPTNVYKTEIKVEAQPGSTVTVEGAGASSTDPGMVPAMSEGIMHMCFWFWVAAFFIVGFFIRNRRHIADLWSGRAKGRKLSTFMHCWIGGDDPSTPNVVEEN